MRTLIASSLFLVVACATPETSTSTNASVALAAKAEAAAAYEAAQVEYVPAQPTPWTEAFMGSAVLMADTILIEGPPGLFEHAVTRADNALFLRRVETLKEGRRQSVRPRPSDQEMQVVRGQLDAWQLAAFREVVLLERVDPNTPVRVIARGEAVWRDTDGHERREAELIFHGEISSPEPNTAEPDTAGSAE